MRLRFSKLALDDIALIHDYTVGEWGQEQAVKYVGVAVPEAQATMQPCQQKPSKPAHTPWPTDASN